MPGKFGHPVFSKYINEVAEKEEIVKKSLEWKSNHIRESEYFFFFGKLQNVCTKIAVDLRSYSKIVKERFLPPPIADTHSTIIGLK